MNEFKRCMRVFSHSPFKVRLMLLSMLCDMGQQQTAQDNLPINSGVAVRRFTPAFYAGTTRFGSEKPHFFVGFANPLRKRFVRQ